MPPLSSPLLMILPFLLRLPLQMPMISAIAAIFIDITTPMDFLDFIDFLH
jgi:hypothetical protein